MTNSVWSRRRPWRSVRSGRNVKHESSAETSGEFILDSIHSIGTWGFHYIHSSSEVESHPFLEDNFPSEFYLILKEFILLLRFFRLVPRFDSHCCCLQIHYCRYSFEYHDDLGVTSNRFTDDPLDNQEYHDVVIKANVPEESTVSTRPPPGEPLSVDSSVRPSKGRRTLWNESGWARSNLLQLLVSIVTVEAGKGTACCGRPTIRGQGPKLWISEQESLPE